MASRTNVDYDIVSPSNSRETKIKIILESLEDKKLESLYKDYYGVFYEAIPDRYTMIDYLTAELNKYGYSVILKKIVNRQPEGSDREDNFIYNRILLAHSPFSNENIRVLVFKEYRMV